MKKSFAFLILGGLLLTLSNGFAQKSINSFKPGQTANAGEIDHPAPVEVDQCRPVQIDHFAPE